MSEEFDDLYDDTEAIGFIRKALKGRLSQEQIEALSDDDISYFIDLIFDYYESRGIFDVDPDSDDLVDIDIQEVVDYMLAAIKKDQYKPFPAELLEAVVLAEGEYTETID